MTQIVGTYNEDHIKSMKCCQYADEEEGDYIVLHSILLTRTLYNIFIVYIFI